MSAFLALPEPSPEAQRLFDSDVEELGYVMNASRLWAYQMGTFDGLFDLMRQNAAAAGLTFRQRGILVTATASALGDSYCSLAWGRKLSEVSDEQTAAGVLRGDDGELPVADRALASWARTVARDPNGASGADVRQLRDAGFTDPQIFSITAYVALRIAFSTVNDALGARPDAALTVSTPPAVLAAVTYGRPIEPAPPAQSE
jgi:alkylhydroperoxidase family enzyme